MVLLFLLLASLASAQDRPQARSMVLSDRGIVATSQTLASQAGAMCCVPAQVRDGLAAKGHELTVTGDFSNQMGGGQAVIYNSATGVKYGASDPRKDGSAVREPHPYFKN